MSHIWDVYLGLGYPVVLLITGLLREKKTYEGFILQTLTVRTELSLKPHHFAQILSIVDLTVTERWFLVVSGRPQAAAPQAVSGRRSERRRVQSRRQRGARGWRNPPLRNRQWLWPGCLRFNVKQKQKGFWIWHGWTERTGQWFAIKKSEPGLLKGESVEVWGTTGTTHFSFSTIKLSFFLPCHYPSCVWTRS